MEDELDIEIEIEQDLGDDGQPEDGPDGYCGGCRYFLHEDSDGLGFCDEYTSWKFCGTKACGLFKPNKDT